MDLVVVEGSQGVSRHGVRSWCGVVGGTWQRFPEIASENEQKLSLQGVVVESCLWFCAQRATRLACVLWMFLCLHNRQ